MPDVGRSDSQRSDTSQRPRVSFNRDVHVKRISGPGGGPRVVGALSGDGEAHLVRRERPWPTKLSRRELAAEARRVLQQADSVSCSPLGYSTLPPLRTNKSSSRRTLSFRNKGLSRSASDASKSDNSSPKRRGQNNKGLSRSASDASKSDNSSPKRRGQKGLTRSASDASKSDNNKSSSKRRGHSKGLSRSASDASKSDNSSSPVRPKRRSHSDSETTPHVPTGPKKQLSPIIEASPREDYFEPMLHSSQTPASRPPLTKGRAVDAMVRRLSEEKPPRRPPRGVSPSALVSPVDGRQHNNNLPFSYTEPPAHVIYAEVVVGAGPKQTVHTAVEPSLETTRGRADGMDSRRKDLITEGYFQPRVGDGFDNYSSYKTEFRSESSRISNDNGYNTEFRSESSRVAKDNGFNKEFRTESSRVAKDNGFSTEYRSESSRIGKDNGFNTEYRTESSRIIKDGFNGKEKDSVDSYKVSSRIIKDGFNGKEKDSVDSYKVSSRIIKDGFSANENDSFNSYKVSNRVIKDGFSTNEKNSLNSYKESPRVIKEKDSQMGDSFNSYKELPIQPRIIDSNDVYKAEYRSESSRVSKVVGSEPPIQPRIIDSSDLSLRRDRLESRIESQRKDRLTSARLVDSSYKKQGYSSRREFLNSQLNVDKKEEGPTAKIVISSPQVTRVELNGLPSDGDETDTADGGRYAPKSTKLVQEQRKVTENLPSSTVLVRQYTDDEEPKPEKKKAPKKKQVSTMDKVKQLFSRSSNSKKEKEKEKKKKEPEEDPLTARYTEYKGSAVESDQETLTPLSQQHSPQSYRRRDHSPSLHHHRESSRSPSPPSSRHRRERTPSPPSRHHRDHSPPSSHHRRERTPSPSRYRRERTPSPSQYRRERTPSPSRYRRERTPSPSRYRRERTPSPSRYRRERTPSPPRHRRDRSPSPPPSRHRMERTPSPRHHRERIPSRTPSPHHHRSHHDLTIEPSPHSTRRRDQHLLQVPLKDHSSGHHRWMSSETEERQKMESVRNRQRLATPTASPAPQRAQSSATLTRINNKSKEKDTSGGWFKSLDRLARKSKPKPKVVEKEPPALPEEKSPPDNKNLRFFGDTDQESVTSIPPPMPLQTHRRYKSNSNVGKLQSTKNHRQQHHRSAGDVATSSAESTTEGDSSQQSQRSVVYLHAATVGDIPTPVKRAAARRARSREELSSVASSHLQPQTRTVSRSISVLAPWKPRHPREALEVHYGREDNNKNYVKNGKPPKVPASQQTSLNSSTMNRINRRKNADNTKQRATRASSVENLKSRGLHSSTSVESLRHRGSHKTPPASVVDQKSKKSSTKVSRSTSMPKDNRVTAGWFKLRNKKQGT